MSRVIRLKVWLRAVLAKIPWFETAWGLGGATIIAAVVHYASRPVPAWCVPVAATVTMLATMLFYRRKESTRAKHASTVHFGIRWLYSTVHGRPTRAVPFPVCEVCGIELRLPDYQLNPHDGSHPGYVECKDCGHRVETELYGQEMTERVGMRIWRDYRAKEGI